MRIHAHSPHATSGDDRRSPNRWKGWRAISHRNFMLFALSIIALVFGPTAMGMAAGGGEALVDYYDGLRAWDLGEKEVAADMWQQAAKYGDRKSMRRLGELYLSGSGVPKDEAEACYWLSIASRLGDTESGPESEKAAQGLASGVVNDCHQKAAAWQAATIPGAAALEASLDPPKPTVADAVQAIDKNDMELLKRAVDQVGAVSKTEDGVPLTFLALAAKREEMLAYLLNAINDPFLGADAVLPDGTTLLDVAIVQKDPALVEIVLAHGASAMLENGSGAAPDEIATKVGNSALADRLKQKFETEKTEFENYLVRTGYLNPGDFSNPVIRKNVMTMYQRFAGVTVSGNIDRLSLRSLRYRPTLDVDLPYRWVLRYEHDTHIYYTSNMLTARTVDDVKRYVDEQCKQEHGKKCKFNFAPAGSCIAVGRPNAGEFRVSAVFPEQAQAESDAMALCRAKSGGQCTLSDSWCVQ